jgi:glucokinase
MNKNKSTKTCAIGVDIGGTNIKSAAVTDAGEMLFYGQTATLPRRSAEEIIEDINRLVEERERKTRDKGYSLRGIGVISPGYPDEEGRVSITPNIPRLVNVPLKRYLRLTDEIPVLFENDGNAGAYGEYIFGQQKKHRHLVVLTLGTGLGSGVVINGKILKEKANISGELGHITLNPDGPVCLCGKRGCLEAYFSGFGLVEAAKRHLQEGYRTKLAKYSVEELNPKAIAKEAMSGDRIARQIFESSARWLGLGISVLINTFNPDKVVLAGGLLDTSGLFFQTMLHETKKHVHPQFSDSFLIEISRFKNHLGVMGAASLFYS